MTNTISQEQEKERHVQACKNEEEEKQELDHVKCVKGDNQKVVSEGQWY